MTANNPGPLDNIREFPERWLKHGIEWSDCASEDGAMAAIEGIEMLRSRIADLEAQLKGQTVGAWIACSERMPEPTRRVLAHSPTKLEPFEAFHMPDFALSHRWQYRNGSYCAEDEITHWMPLPPAPPEQPKGTDDNV